MTIPTIQEANAAVLAARIALRNARIQLDAAMNQLVMATAKEAAAYGLTHDKFVAACVANARCNRAQCSGGADHAENVIEAATRQAWLNAAEDIHLFSLFHKEQ